ncbi:14898_t:CDS:10 [Entrophospora sp. SA101]|nr:14898_t:CDS:10 [Entrophospora sp. SA101]
MTEVSIDNKLFHKHLNTLYIAWRNSLKKESDDSFKGAELFYAQWLFGQEFDNMLMIFTLRATHFVINESLVEQFEKLKGNEKNISIVIHNREKQDAEKFFKEILSDVTEGKKLKRIGIFIKDKPVGDFVDNWKSIYSNFKNKDIEEVDITLGIQEILSIKDEDELKTMRMAGKLSSAIMYRVVNQISNIVDEEKKITHKQLSDDVEAILYNRKKDKWLSNQKIFQDVNFDLTEMCYSPNVQSGGLYDFKISSPPDKRELHGDIVLCSLGVRYKGYCSNIGRTILFDPVKKQETNYKFLLELQSLIMEWCRDGVRFRDVYNKAQNHIKTKRPELLENFVKTLGHGIGIEFHESAFLLSPNSDKVLKNGMVLNLFVGLQNIKNLKAKDDQTKNYSLWIIDTIKISNGTCHYMTDGNRKSDSTTFFINDEEEENKKDDKKGKKPASRPQIADQNRPSTRNSAILKSKFRSGDKGEDDSAKRKEHQAELARQKQVDGLARYAEGLDQTTDQKEVVLKTFESYRRDTAIPKEIYVDQRNETVIIPIFGYAVPFHIATIKNVHKSEEGDYTYLRVNFLTPGQATGKKEDMPFDDPTISYIRSLTFRSTDDYMGEVYKKIVDLKKNSAKKEAEQKEMADLIVQDKLVEVKGRRPTHRLSEVFVRPELEGKKVTGDLDIHENGIRYTSRRSNQKIDMLYSNIKHLFFQPCDYELIVILHIHLINPIIFGKKKAKDIQFFREASDIQFDETGNRKRRTKYGDEDEIGAEQEENKRRFLLNKDFKSFANKIAESSDGKVYVDVPFRDIGFSGVPFKTNVLLQPTTDCLVHLVDLPFLIITMADVEVVNLERIQYGLKNFDMVLIFKDYSRPPIHINTIPMSQLEGVKEWLDSIDILFYEGTLNLNWAQIMRNINKDPAGFYNNGGWSFLDMDEKDGDSDAPSDSASEFEPTESEEEDFESSSDYEDEAEESVNSESEGESDDDESIVDWDESEEKVRTNTNTNTNKKVRRR